MLEEELFVDGQLFDRWTFGKSGFVTRHHTCVNDEGRLSKEPPFVLNVF
jgi:hypothetical protein